jgi:hypothetical protein
MMNTLWMNVPASLESTALCEFRSIVFEFLGALGGLGG